MTETERVGNIRCTADTIALTRHPRLRALLSRVVGRTPYRHVLLSQRDRPPYESTWAIPGGHVDPGETGTRASARELLEETDVVVSPADLVFVGIFDEPDRYPRGQHIGAAFAFIVPDGTPATAGDDARTAQWRPVDSLPPLTFDHAEILSKAVGPAIRRLRRGAPGLRHHPAPRCRTGC
ncbi:NUDIX hydrolase [Streptomyces sp. NPDC050610]|uniref:NUDIX hydrolase n=1 Tax=Streptomyces sp. NPDC050610 TaxID=3157097 RepID=UPI00342EA0F3